MVLAIGQNAMSMQLYHIRDLASTSHIHLHASCNIGPYSGTLSYCVLDLSSVESECKCRIQRTFHISLEMTMHLLNTKRKTSCYWSHKVGVAAGLLGELELTTTLDSSVVEGRSECSVLRVWDCTPTLMSCGVLEYEF